MKRFRVLVFILSILVLSSCGTSAVSGVPPLTLDEVAGKRLAQMSVDEREGLIYRYVSDTIRVDKERLISIDSSDISRINTLLQGVEKDLINGTSEVLSEEYANYLLTEFARTPYEWRLSGTEPVGFDPSTRMYFIDVTFKTTNTFKTVVPSSKIPYGAPMEQDLRQQRYRDYIAYLTYKIRGQEEVAEQMLQEFESKWGSLDSVFQEQQGVSLLERTALTGSSSEGIGRLTYSGLVEDTRFTSGAELVIRFVLKYNLNLGEETDLQVVSLYLKEYKLNNASTIVDRFDTGRVTGLEVLKPFIDKLIFSFHRAIEGSNDEGLYSLYNDYSGVDKYYDDLRKYTYSALGGYNFRVLQRSGTNVVLEVERVHKYRAKGTNMSLPTYDERLVYTLVLGNDDKIRIRGVHLLESELVGEPISLIKNVTGISEQIQYSGESFTESNKVKVEEALKKFSEVVFNAQVDTPEFSEIVDMGVSEIALQRMSEYITAIPNAKRKVNYVVSWDTRTNVFVSVTLREIFETEGENFDTESVVDLVNRNGEWKVVNYTRTVNIRTASAAVDSKGALSENIR